MPFLFKLLQILGFAAFSSKVNMATENSLMIIEMIPYRLVIPLFKTTFSFLCPPLSLWPHSLILYRWPKSIACQLFLQQRRVSWDQQRIAVGAWQATCKSSDSRGRSVYRGKDKTGEGGFAVVNSLGLLISWVLSGQGVFLLPVGLCDSHRVWVLPLLSPSLLN